MRTSELHKSQPILTFLAPTSANAASLCQPTQSPFHNPTTCRLLLVIWNGFRQWFTPSSSVSNMLLIVSFCNQKMDIIEIIPFIQTEMLFLGWTLHHNRKDEVSNRPFIMLICASDMNSQRGTTLVNQDMNLCPTLTTVSRIVPGCPSTQRRGYRFAIDRLPFPTYPSFSIVEANHCLHDFVPNTLLLPSLEPFMQNTAGNAEPIFVDSLPLTTRPHNVPEAIDDGAIVSTRSSWPSFFGRLRQMLLDSTPQGTWDSKIIDILWLCVTLVFVNDAPPWMKFFRKYYSPRGASFFQVNLFFG
jgi:hypothetical protein